MYNTRTLPLEYLKNVPCWKLPFANPTSSGCLEWGVHLRHLWISVLFSLSPVGATTVFDALYRNSSMFETKLISNLFFPLQPLRIEQFLNR